MVSANSGNKGFTLLEVMVALAILAAAVTTLLSLGNRSIAARGEVQYLTRATLLAEQKITEVETFYRLGKSGDVEEEGTFEEPFGSFRWEIAFADTLVPGILQVDVMVLWGAAQKNEKVELSSFVIP